MITNNNRNTDSIIFTKKNVHTKLDAVELVMHINIISVEIMHFYPISFEME